MMKRVLIVIAALGLTLAVQAETRQRYSVTTKGRPRAAMLRVAANSDGSVPEGRLRVLSNVDGFVAELTAEEAAELRRMPGVETVERTVPRYASAMPDGVRANLESYARQVVPWGLPVVRAREVWSVTRGEGVNVVVLDTGFDFDHPDLKDLYAGGFNVFRPNQLPVDDNFHGTHVAGTVAAIDNAFGIVGAAPGVKLWIVKALDETGHGDDAWVAQGIDWAVSKQKELGGRWIVNMSLGAAVEGGQLEKRACDRAVNAGVILVAAAGNRGQAFVDYPGAYPGVIAVGAADQDGKRAQFSSYGPNLLVMAPGVDVESTFLKGFVEASDVVVGSNVFNSLGVIASPKGQASGKIVACGIGRPEDIPASVRGNIALIARGTLEFREKARYAKEAGAVAVIISDNEPGVGLKPWTLTPKACTGAACGPGWENYVFPLTVGVTYEDGEKLRKLANQNATVAFEFAGYGKLSGTSMATPHVAGIVALMLSLDPSLKPIEVANILRKTAQDTGAPGWDLETGAGMVDALAAAHWIAPDKFDVPPPPQKKSKRRSARS